MFHVKHKNPRYCEIPCETFTLLTVKQKGSFTFHSNKDDLPLHRTPLHNNQRKPHFFPATGDRLSRQIRATCHCIGARFAWIACLRPQSPNKIYREPTERKRKRGRKSTVKKKVPMILQKTQIFSPPIFPRPIVKKKD